MKDNFYIIYEQHAARGVWHYYDDGGRVYFTAYGYTRAEARRTMRQTTPILKEFTPIKYIYKA